jgi:hypothetical protein
MTIRLGFAMAAMLLVACNSQEGETPQATKAPAAAVEAHSEVTDTVYTNGKIYTVNEAQPWVEAMAIKDGKFLVVGTNAEVLAVSDGSTSVIDLSGSFVMPGIGDSHIHPALVMPKRAYCGSPGTFYEPTEKDTPDALKNCIASYPEHREWFIAAGFTIPAMSPEASIDVAVLLGGLQALVVPLSRPRQRARGPRSRRLDRPSPSEPMTRSWLSWAWAHEARARTQRPM